MRDDTKNLLPELFEWKLLADLKQLLKLQIWHSCIALNILHEEIPSYNTLSLAILTSPKAHTPYAFLGHLQEMCKAPADHLTICICQMIFW